MRFEIKTYGTSPITVAQVKSYAKISTDSDNDNIQILIDSVVSYAERMTHRELRNNTWTGYFDSFAEELKLNRLNVEQINSIKYLSNNAVQTVDNSIYYVNRDVLCSYVELYPDKDWPSDVDNVADAVTIEFTTSADMRLPELRHYMLRHITNAYENRGDELVGVYYSAESIDFYKKIALPNF